VKGAALALHQYRYDQRQFWREPASVFFTVVLPLIFLFLFASIFGNEPVRGPAGEISFATYYVPGILTLSLVSATFVNLSITLTILRERGELKRLRATPIPVWIVIAGRTLTALGVTAVMVVVLVAIGALAYDVEIPGGTLPGALLTLVVGVGALSALGFAFTAAIPSENAAAPMANAIVLPLYFISGIFVPEDQLPDAMQTIGAVFPVQPLFDALLIAFDPFTSGVGFAWADLAVVAAWGVGGALVALARFRWVPRR
jgi:ABC-2 type transport system permease protein